MLGVRNSMALLVQGRRGTARRLVVDGRREQVAVINDVERLHQRAVGFGVADGPRRPEPLRQALQGASAAHGCLVGRAGRRGVLERAGHCFWLRDGVCGRGLIIVHSAEAVVQRSS